MTLPGGAIHEKNEAKRRHKASMRTGSQKRGRRALKWTLRGALAMVILLVIGGGFLFTKGYFKLNQVFKGGGTAAALQADVKPELLKGEGDGRVNILMLGRGGPGHEGPDLTDTILVASIDPQNKTSTLVSIPRDTWVSVPGQGSSKINSIFANAKYRALNNNSKDIAGAEKAGVTTVEEVVSQILGVPIHYYSMVDFAAFEQAVNTVGGVTIDVPSDLVDHTMAWKNSGNSILAKKGSQTFDGRQALMYVRSRMGSARGDFDRTERQRLFITALTGKVLSAGTYTNPLKVSQLMSAFGDHVSTDLSISNAVRLGTIGKEVNLGAMQSIGLADPPQSLLRTDNINGQSVVVPVAGVGDYSQVQAFIRNTLKDPYIAKENPSLAVLNGTSVAGLATKKADELKSYGYSVTQVATAPTQEYAKTVIVDLTAGKKPYTLHYLENRLGVKATTKLPDSTIQATGADFVIILGQDATTTNQN